MTFNRYCQMQSVGLYSILWRGVCRTVFVFALCSVSVDPRCQWLSATFVRGSRRCSVAQYAATIRLDESWAASTACRLYRSLCAAVIGRRYRRCTSIRWAGDRPGGGVVVAVPQRVSTDRRDTAAVPDCRLEVCDGDGGGLLVAIDWHRRAGARINCRRRCRRFCCCKIRYFSLRH